MPIKKVLIYIHNGWVFGKIHNELIKALHPEVYCDIVCWDTPVDANSFKHLVDKYDLIITPPALCFKIHNEFGIPLEKMIGCIHGNWDVVAAVSAGMTSDQFFQLAGYTAVCPLLQHVSLSHGVARVPQVLPIGIYQENYPRNTSTNVSRIGMFSRMKRVDQGYDLKRGSLVEEVARKTGLGFVTSEAVHFLAVETLYKEVDLVINASLSEGNPYPMLEAFACGIPCLSTPTGIAGEYLRSGGGVLLPMEADDLVYSASYEIGKMRQNSGYYRYAISLMRLGKRSTGRLSATSGSILSIN
jgi:glycosyltransferase involved in cell wall biosynthesis